jgi:hypothetical protein
MAARIERAACGAFPDIAVFLAIETMGSAEQLAKVLGASVGEIDAWTRRHADPPPGAFLKAIDVVTQAG